MNFNIVFVLESISQPRCIKRVRSFLNKTPNVKVYGFDRGVYNLNSQVEDFEIEILAQQEDGKNYLSKIGQFFTSIKRIVKDNPDRSNVFYSFGIAITFFLMLRKVKYIYEMSDLLYAYNSYKRLQWLFKRVDRFLIRRSLITVVTSEGFLDYLYQGKEKPNNVIFQPNRLDSLFERIPRPDVKPCSVDNLVFAFVGLFRYPNTVFRFASVIGEKFPNHEFHFYGDGDIFYKTKIESLIKKYKNVKCLGPYKNPDGLQNVYSEVDILIASYDIEHLNERIAEPNKLYEAMFFRKPIVVSKDTFLEKQVSKYNCGFAIDASEDSEIEFFVRNLSDKKLNEVQIGISKLELSTMIDDNSKKIFNALFDK